MNRFRFVSLRMRCGLAALLIFFALSAMAQEKTLSLGGVPFALRDVSGQAEVYFSAFRLNRASNVWNVEATIRNLSGESLPGPIVLYVQSWTGSAGFVEADGLDGTNPFYQLDAFGLEAGQTTVPRTLTLQTGTGTPSVVARVFALSSGSTLSAAALVRSLNEAGQPLADVTVVESGPGGVRTNRTDWISGLATLGLETGAHEWMFSKPGYAPVWRQLAIDTNGIALLPSPRLTPLNTNKVVFTPIAGGSVVREEISINFGPGSFATSAAGSLTLLTGQTLPALLPMGWSPVGAFWFSLDQTPQLPGTLLVKPWDRLAPSENASLVRWNEVSRQWDALQSRVGQGTNAISFELTVPGAYAVVVPDSGQYAPPAAISGQALAGVQAAFTNFTNLRAFGTVTPSLRAASQVPELATAQALVVFTNLSGALPSGLLLDAEVTESYEMADQTRRYPPVYENTIVAYQRPADGDLATLVASFPMRPVLLLAPEELAQANVHVDVLPPRQFPGVVLDSRGGQIYAGPVRISSAASNLTGQVAIRLNLLSPAQLAGLSTNVVAGFEIAAGPLNGSRLDVQFAPQAPNSFYVLARVLSQSGLYGLEPVERFHSDAAGRMLSVEPASGERLPGVTGSGQYALIRVAVPHGIVRGTVTGAQSTPLVGAVIQLDSWLAFSGDAGQYRLLAPQGNSQIVLADLRTADVNVFPVALQDWQAGLVLNLEAVPQGPRVLAISPAPGATAVPLVSPVTITFSKPVNPGSALPAGIVLLGASNQPVAASLSFNLRGNIATLLPVDPLPALTLHTLWLSTNLADLGGRTLVGSNEFSFTTIADQSVRDAAARITSYEPTNGVMRMVGSPGIAEPNAPVILVNETTGFTTTVISKPDGSFESSIPAEEDDLLAAVFVNANNTRNTIPVSRQVYRDGTIGLFSGGGTVQATNSAGVVDVLVEPGSIAGRTRIKVEALDVAGLPAFATNVPAGSPKPLGGLKVRLTGDPLLQSMDVSFPIDVAALGLPPGENPTNATYALAIPRQVEGDGGVTNTVYEIIDRMQFEDGKLVTHSPPFYGLLPALNLDLFTVPLFMSVGHQMTIAGRVYSAELDAQGRPRPGTERMLPGAVVSAVPPGAPVGIPGRLRPGTITATAGGTNSSYAMMVVVTEAAPAIVTATHPRFPGVSPVAYVPAMSQAERFSLGNFFRPVDVVFPTRNALDLSDPSILFSHSPERPAPGSNAVVRIVGSDNAARPTLTISIAEATSLDTGTNVPPEEIDLSLFSGEDLGAFTRRELWTVSSPIPSRVLVQARAVDENGNETIGTYPLFFGGSEAVASNTIPAADPNDTTGPRVISSIPSRGGLGVMPGQPIVLRFDEPIDRALLQDATIISLTPGNPRPLLRLSNDQMELTLNFPGLVTNTEYTLTLNSGVKDISGNRLDQDPVAEGNNSFVLQFNTVPLVSGNFTGIQMGGGAVTRGIYAYVLDRNTSSNASVGIYDLSNPSAPQRVSQFLLGGGYPRDLVLIPNYSFARTNGGPVETKDLLAVVGGLTGVGRSQYLRLVDISNPLNPEWLAGIALSFNPESVVSRIQWSPPYLGYLEGGSVNSVSIIDLQTLILFEHMSAEEYKTMPDAGFPGVDANGDGDYVDPGDQLPLPARYPVEFASKLFSFTLENSDAWISDFALAKHGQFLGVIADEGHLLTNGVPSDKMVPPVYRTLYSDGTFPEAELASFVFTNARPRRVTILEDFPLVDENLSRLARLALVSFRKNPGFEEGQTNWLAVLDVTEPVNPYLLTQIPIPNEYGSIFSVVRREDGLLLLAADRDLLLIDPANFRLPLGEDGLHPAIVGVIPGAGDAMRTFDGTLAGLNVVSLESRNQLVLGPPTIEFVCAPTNFPFIPVNLTNLPAPALQSILGGFEPVNDLWLSRFRAEPGVVPSTLSPALGVTHYYVLVHAPGSAGETIELALESLNWAGQPFEPMGFLFPPVHAFSGQTLQALEAVPLPEEAPVRSSTAWRLSANKASPYYNLYLSRPFALIGEEISKEEIQTLQSEVDRDILWSGAYLRASLDPVLKDNPVLGRFVGRVNAEDATHYPGVEALAFSHPADYIQSPSPEPMIGAVTLTDALGAIGAHNGELRAETADMVLPGRRLPIEFRRFNGAQGLYNGAFGRGWDFNFNQRLVELGRRGMSPSAKLPLVVRDTLENSEVATVKDILFYNGSGRVIAWKDAGTNAPPEVASDPLVTEHLRWTNQVARYYLPPPGAFNLLFKFKDGRYARLEPDGTQYWYNPAGRLTKIYDRYDKNSLELVYNARGELIRIYDEVRRPLDIGWWRLPTDPLRRPGIDETTLRTAIAGKICRLLDYSNRDVLFYYTEDGLLERREGPLVETASINGFTGRPVTRYNYSDSTQPGRSGKALTGILGGDTIGTPLIAATEVGLKGRDTVSKVKVAAGEIKVDLGQTNTAKALSTGTAFALLTNPDQSTTRYKFDRFGRPTEVTLRGQQTPEQKTVTEYYTNGLIKSVTHPEGNRIEYVYDATNASLRARANVLRVTKYPGPRGGPVLQATTEYDGWYNLPAGTKTDFRTNAAVITLRLDHRDTERVNKAGQVESFLANEFGQIEKHTGIDNITREWVYDENGFLRRFKIGALETVYGYAPATGVRSDFTLRGLASSITDPRNIVTEFIYDERNQLVRSTRAGQQTAYAYDHAGNVKEVRTRVDAGRELIEERTYDQLGFMLSKTLKDVEVEGVPTDIVTTFEPDAFRRVKRAVFPGGQVHELEYDHTGQITNYVIGGTYREVYAYDGNGNRVSTTIGTATERHVYDGHDRLVQIVTADGTTNHLAYDGNNNIVGKKTVARDGAVLSEMAAEFDELNRPKLETRQRDDGVSTANYDYNTAERTITFTDALGASVTTYYDDVGRIWKEVTPTRTTETLYDGNGNVEKRTIREGLLTRVEEFKYNERDQLVESKDNLGRATKYELGLDGRVKVLHDRENFATTNQFTILGEPALTLDPNGVTTVFGRATNRQVSLIQDAANHSLRTEFDSLGRVRRVLLPNQAETLYADFDALNSPRSISAPRGIQISAAYDGMGQLTNRVFTGLNGTRAEHYTYDGLRRLKAVTDPSGSVEFAFDKFGYTRQFAYNYQFQAAGANPATLQFALEQRADAGGFRSEVTYPAGTLTIVNQRDNTGRLVGLAPAAGETLMRSNRYSSEALTASRELGNGRILMEMAYDELNRPSARRFVNLSSGKALIDVRYGYDKNGAQRARQFVHRNGRADFFQYDPGYRLTRADMGAHPQVGVSSRAFPGFATPPEIAGNWAPGAFAREAGYSNTDVLTSISAVNPDNLVLPPMGSSFGAPDELLFVPSIDGTSRLRDDVGNTVVTRLFVRVPGSTVPAPVAATNTYNELNQLVRIARADGVVIENEYNPSGLRMRRKVTGNPALCVPSDTAFIYDGGNLIEERDLMNNAALVARYFYGDDGDELIAGDILKGGSLMRHYFLSDVTRSVLAVADENGNIVERVQYDAWGQPMIEAADTVAPQVERVSYETNSLLIEFTEPVLPAFNAIEPTGFVTQLRDPGNVIQVRVNDATVPGQVVFEENAPGKPFGTTYRFVAANLSGAAQLIIFAGGLQDDANNTNAQISINLNLTAPGVVFTGPGSGSTAPAALSRSSLGSPFLFHGQVFDYDSGLVYCRARFYDPASGMFLQRDPSGYIDGVNQYAGFANNPISLRDPTGQATPESMDQGEGAERQTIGSYLTDSVKQSIDRVLDLGTATAQGVDLLNSGNPGSQGALDAMRGAELILSDAQVAAGAFGVLKLGINASVGLTRRAAHYMQKFRSSPQIPASVRDHLIKSGLTQVEIDAIIPAMKKHGVSRLSIRSFGEKRFARQAGVRGGLPQKPMSIKDKTGFDSTITRDGVKYVSDADILHVEINGRPATVREIQKFTQSANRNYTKLWNQRGLGTLGVPANPPFQHGSHLSMAQMYERGGKVNGQYIASVGHPGDSFSIRIQGNGNVLAYDTPRWKTHQDIMRMGSVLQNKMAAQGVPALSFPDNNLWPGKNWNDFRKDYVNESLSYFYDPVNARFDESKMRRFFGPK